MKYNFSTINKRFHVGSNKWNEIHQYLPEFDEDIVPFSVADMEFETAPEIKKALKEYIDKYVMGYANPTDTFRSVVCDWMKRRHNWEIQPDWIISTHGVIDAFFMAVKAYTNPGDGVMLMTPVYYPLYSAIEKNSRVLVDNPLANHNGEYEIDWEDFERKAKDSKTKLLILCSPHNPTGRVWKKEELERIGHICIDNGVIICSDEIHFDIVMPGYHHTVFASLSEEFARNCIVCTAPSKTFNLAGLQTSNIIIPNERLREMFYQVQLTECMNPKCNILGYEANRVAYEGCEEWLEEMLKVIDQNRKLVISFMAREFPEVVITPLEGTYLLWMNFNALNIDYMELAKILRLKAQLFFDDGSIFGEQGKGFKRWNLACPSRYISEGLERLKAALK